ncbi:MAG: hypothetical protein FJX42_01060 [Alphaproteobacteria bacterium]|nr:hypothetical protein [Alphaproteobacteria bacterium]
MHYVVIAHDGTDEKALDRRMKAREAHLAGAKQMKQDGRMLMGGAMMDDAGKMIGSVMVVDFPDRARLDAWLKNDPYTTGDVWQKIEVRPYRIAGLS